MHSHDKKRVGAGASDATHKYQSKQPRIWREQMIRDVEYRRRAQVNRAFAWAAEDRR